jgi:hypothetical protein
MPPGIGATGFIGIAPETTMGIFVAPTTYVPVLTDELKYTESKYYSQQLRQQVIDSDVKPGYYHIEGTIELEVDTNNFLYFLYASRHTIVKTGAGPYSYTFTPSTAGSTSTAASGAVQRTLSITSVKNGIVFGYTGCTVTQYEFTISDAVLKCTLNIIGLGEAVQSLPTATWIAPDLLGADSHNVFTGASGVTPTFAQVFGFNGYTLMINHNAEAQNRIQSQRSANYVKFGKTDFEVRSDLDFIDRVDFDNMKSSATQAIKLESTVGGTAYSGATDGIQLQVNRAAFDTYEIPSSGMGDLIMAHFVGHGLAQVGGNGYEIGVKSAISIS